jgi:hypothetical protein
VIATLKSHQIDFDVKRAAFLSNKLKSLLDTLRELILAQSSPPTQSQGPIGTQQYQHHQPEDPVADYQIPGLWFGCTYWPMPSVMRDHMDGQSYAKRLVGVDNFTFSLLNDASRELVIP